MFEDHENFTLLYINAKLFLIPSENQTFHHAIGELTEMLWKNGSYGVSIEELL